MGKGRDGVHLLGLAVVHSDLLEALHCLCKGLNLLCPVHHSMSSAISLGEPDNMNSFYALPTIPHSFAALLLFSEISQLHSFFVV